MEKENVQFFLKRESEKQCGDRRGNQDVGGGKKDACEKRSFAGLRDVAIITPVLSSENVIPYNPEFMAADALMQEYGVNSLDKVKAQILKPEFVLINLDIDIHSLSSAQSFYDDDGMDPNCDFPQDDQFVAVMTVHDFSFPIAKTERDHFLATMLSRYSLLPVFSAVTVIDEEEERFFPDEDFTKEQFLAGIPPIMRNPIDDPTRIFSLLPSRNFHPAHQMTAQEIIDDLNAPNVIAPLVESCKRYVELYRETKGFQLYDPDGTVPAICIMTKEPDENGICPVRRLFDDELEMASSSDNGYLPGCRMISHTFTANRPGLFRERLDCFLHNAALTLIIAKEIGKNGN